MVDSIITNKDWVDTIPPEAACEETVNPHGNTTPPAGSTTLPGSKGGINEDGFYELLATDNLIVGCAPLVINAMDADGFVYGPFGVGDIVKYTEDNTVGQEEKKIGSTNGKGQADAVTAHLIGHGDLEITATDGAGNVSSVVSCLVPKPPK